MADRNDANQGREQEPRDMAEIVERARSVDPAELRSAGNKHLEDVEAEAARTRRVVDATSGGDVPRGRDDPQQLTGTVQQTPMPSETGGSAGDDR